MDFPNAFLIFTVISYYTFGLVPKPTTKTIKPLWLEKATMFILGTLLLINLILNIYWLWWAYAVMWSIGACLSYLGYVQWNVSWKIDASNEAQMTMWLWDTLITLCCFTKL